MAKQGSEDRDSQLIGWAEAITDCSIDEAGFVTANFLMIDNAWIAVGGIVGTTIIAVTLLGPLGLILLGALYFVKRITNPEVAVAVSKDKIFLVSVTLLTRKPSKIISQFPISAVSVAKGEPVLLSVHGRAYEVDEPNWKRLLQGLTIAKKHAQFQST